MILLQTPYDILGGPGGTPTSTIVAFLAVIAGVIVLVLIATIINRRRAPRAPGQGARFSRSAFRRTAKAFGLPQAHTDMLENLVRANKVQRPTLVFTSPSLLDDTLKKGLYALQSLSGGPPGDKESRAAIIYQIKQIIERGARQEALLESSMLLKPGQVLTITPHGGSSFASRIVSNMKDSLIVATPQGTSGAEVRWARGTPLSVYLRRDNDAGYTFQTKVLGYETVKGVSSVLLQHSKSLRREQRRKNRRREIKRACFVYPVRVAEIPEGRGVQRKASVDKNARGLGTVSDLSAGGCAIETTNPFDKGKLVMIEFDIERKAPIRAFGKVMSSNRQRGRGGSMHVMFTNVTRQHLNKISEFVYGFGPASPGGEPRQRVQRTI